MRFGSVEKFRKTGKTHFGHVKNRLLNGQKQFRSFGIKTAIGVSNALKLNFFAGKSDFKEQTFGYFLIK